MFFGTAEQRRRAVKRPELQAKLCFYLPKTESHAEAAWFSDLLAAMEEAIGIPVGGRACRLDMGGSQD